MGNRFREKVVEEGLETSVDEVVEQSDGTAPSQPQAAASTLDMEESESKEEQGGRRSRGDKVAKGLAKVLGGDILGDKLVVKQIPLLLLCLFFLLLLVANRYKVESLSREKIASLERINDLREQRIQMQKQYQKSVKISQIAEELSEIGVGITSGPPYEIE